MTKVLIASLAAGGLILSSASALAQTRTEKGAAVGGVAGAVVGHSVLGHGLLGAAAGAVGGAVAGGAVDRSMTAHYRCYYTR